MAFGESTAGLLFRISAKDDASEEIKKIRKVVDSETAAIRDSNKNVFSSLGTSAGLSTAQIGSLSTALPLAGAAITAIAGVATGAAAGLFNLAQNASEFGSQIFDISKKTGLGAETISTLNFAAKQAGTSIESVSTSLTLFEKNIGKAADGGKQATETMKRLGIDPQAAIKDLDGALAQVFKRISELRPGVEQTTAATNAFGRSGAELIPLIQDVGGNFDEFKKRAKELGVVLTDEDARAADEFGDTLDKLKSQAEGVAFQFAKGFMPQLTAAMATVSSSFSNNQSVVQAWGREVGNTITGLVTVFDRLNKASDSILTALGLKALDTATKIRSLLVLASPLTGILALIGERNTPQVLEDGRFQKSAVGTAQPRFDSTPETRRTGDFFKGLESDAKNAASSLSKVGKESERIATGLPKVGEGFLAYGRASKQFGTTNTIDNLERLASAFKATTGKILGIGELSQKGGGHYDGHLGHARGTEADIRPVRNDGSGAQVTFRDLKNYDQDATRKLIQLIKSENPGAIVLFNDPQLIKEGLTRKYAGHDNHLHVTKLGGEGKEIDLQAIEDKRAEKLERSQDAAQKRSESAASNNLKTIIGNLNYEVDLREDANKIILANQEVLLAKGEINEQGFARVRIFLEEDILKIKLENKAKELSATEEFHRKELIAFDAAAARELDRAKPEDKKDTAAKSGDERKALLAKQLEEETGIKREGQKIDDEITAKTIENQNTIAVGARKTAEARKAAAAEILELQRQVLDAERDLEIFRAEQERKILVNTVEHSSGRAKLDALVVLRNADLLENERQRDAELKRARQEHDDALAKIKDLEAEREKVQAINDLYERRKDAINLPADERKRDITTSAEQPIRQASRAITPAGVIDNIFGEDGDSKVNKTIEQGKALEGVFSSLSGTVKNAAGNMVKAMGSAIEAYILYGGSIGKVLKQAAAAELAHISSTAAIKAIYQLAEGFASLFFNPAAAASHFTAAALYGSLALGAGIAGRALAGGGQKGSQAFASQTSSGTITTTQGRTAGSGGGSYYSAANDDGEKKSRLFEENRIRQTSPQVIELHVKSNDSHIANVVQENINNRGGIHGLILKVVDP